MTLLGAVAFDDQVVVCADRLVTQVEPGPEGTLGPPTLALKMESLPRVPTLMWGWAGDSPVGAKLHDWFDLADIESWESLRAQLPMVMRNAHRLTPGGRPTDVLVAGVLSGIPAALSALSDGGIDWSGLDDEKGRPILVGLSRYGLRLAWDLLIRFDPGRASPEGFREFFREALRLPQLRSFLGGFASWTVGAVTELHDCEDPALGWRGYGSTPSGLLLGGGAGC